MKETITALPSIFIYKEAVNQLVKNYQQGGKHELLSNEMGEREETKSGWYSREQFEELVREMNLHDASGIRMYFGAYNAEHPEYANQLTIIFVPTSYDEAENVHRDIVIDDTLAFKAREEMSSALIGKPIIKNLDTIGLCPPTCAGHESFYPYDEA